MWVTSVEGFVVKVSPQRPSCETLAAYGAVGRWKKYEHITLGFYKSKVVILCEFIEVTV